MGLSVGAVGIKPDLCKEKIMISLVEGDITKQEFDDPEHAALVNAANSQLAFGGGVCGAVFKAAGPEKLVGECNKYPNGCPVGEAVITGSCDIKDNGGAHYVIHAVGPQKVDEHALFDAYYNTLALADKHAITAIALPAISTGIFGYDVEAATPVALNAILTYVKQYPATSLRDIRLVTFKQSQARMVNHAPEDYVIYAKNLHDLVESGIILPKIDPTITVEKKLEPKSIMNFEILVATAQQS